jgi:hypothetical protein
MTPYSINFRVLMHSLNALKVTFTKKNIYKFKVRADYFIKNNLCSLLYFKNFFTVKVHSKVKTSRLRYGCKRILNKRRFLFNTSNKKKLLDEAGV